MYLFQNNELTAAEGICYIHPLLHSLVSSPTAKTQHCLWEIEAHNPTAVSIGAYFAIYSKAKHLGNYTDPFPGINDRPYIFLRLAKKCGAQFGLSLSACLDDISELSWDKLHSAAQNTTILKRLVSLLAIHLYMVETLQGKIFAKQSGTYHFVKSSLQSFGLGTHPENINENLYENAVEMFLESCGINECELIDFLKHYCTDSELYHVPIHMPAAQPNTAPSNWEWYDEPKKSRNEGQQITDLITAWDAKPYYYMLVRFKMPLTDSEVFPGLLKDFSVENNVEYSIISAQQPHFKQAEYVIQFAKHKSDEAFAEELKSLVSKLPVAGEFLCEPLPAIKDY